MTINTIYLDMDGVLADFDKKKLEVFGTLDVDGEAFWPIVHRNYPRWFNDLEPMPDFDELVVYVETSECNIAILSALPNPKYDKVHQCLTSKYDWVQHYMPGVPPIFCVRSHKATYANPFSVLIDDTEQNIIDWQKKGGIGILHKSAKETIEQLKLLSV